MLHTETGQHRAISNAVPEPFTERGIWMSDINLFTWTRAQQAALALAVLTGSFLGLVTAPQLIGG